MNKFDVFVRDLANAVHNFGSHSFKYYLSNTLPVATNAVKADIAEIATGAGYTGPQTLTVSTNSQTSGVYTLKFSAPTLITATGNVATFRYVVIYNDTATSPADALIGWVDHGSALALTSGQTWGFEPDQVDGLFTIT